MDVSITGRHLTINEAHRELLTQRLTTTIAKLKDRVNRVEVEFTNNDKKGDPNEEIRCEITLRGPGPVVRASAHASDKMIAFDKAEDRLTTQLRRAADRRKRQRGLRGVKDLEALGFEALAPEVVPEEQANADTITMAGIEITGDGPMVVREKRFTSTPLTLEQALDEMELVGHDFFLYVDANTKEPSVVYRRRAYDYGVIHLDVTEDAE